MPNIYRLISLDTARDVEPMLGQRRRRWTKIKPTLVQHPVPAVVAVSAQNKNTTI